MYGTARGTQWGYSLYAFQVYGTPTGSSTTPPPSGGGTTPPPSGGGTTPPPSGGGTTPPPPASGTPVPTGPSGNWALKFDDEFSGSSLDTSKWTNTWFNGGSMNGVSTVASNVSEGNGSVDLKLSDSSHGALIHTDGDSVAGRACLPVGGVAEARILFVGNGSQINDWSAWWANSTVNWPSAGEQDIAEVLGGSLTVNYHSPSGSHNQGAVPGYWGDAYHTYTIYRKPGSADVYWDGVLRKSYSTDDNGACEDLILNVGNGNPLMAGSAAMKVDYVRTWTPG
jgi:hypothetical protein